MYILLSGKVPFPGDSNKEIIENVLRAELHFDHEVFKTVSDEAKDLISKLLVKDVEARYNAEQAYNHPWIQKKLDSDNVLADDALLNMKNYLNATSLKKITLSFLASKLPEDFL